MNRCDSCKTLSTCPLCGASATSFRHVGVRGTTSQFRIPVIDYDITYDRQPSGIWHYSQPCNHRVHPTAVSSIVKYNGGPLWQDGYTWQDIYWGTYYTKPSSAQWISRVELAVAHLESDPGYSGGLRQYNVGIGKTIRAVTIRQDPPSQLSNSEIRKMITAWINAGTVADLGTTGAYNIFLPPGTTASLSGDQSCGAFCLPPDEILLGDNKPIADFAAGDKVVGLSGLESVTRKLARPFEGKLWEIKAGGMLPVRVTPEHPVLTVRGVGHSKTVYSSPVWRPAKELREKHTGEEGDYLVMPKLSGQHFDKMLDLRRFFHSGKAHPRITLFPINERTAWLFGIYVAEGNSYHSGLNFSLHEAETSIRTRISQSFKELGYSSCMVQSPGVKCKRILVSATIIGRAFAEWCGKGAARKKIPDFILYHKDENILRSFLEGYTEGDSCTVWNREYELLIVNTISRVLIQQLQLAYARLGLFMSIRKSRDAMRNTILGRHVSYHEQYEGRLYPKPVGRKMNRLHGELFYIPIRKLSLTPFKGMVYNIETADHSYLASNAIVHNCDYHDTVNGPDGPFFTVEPYPCARGCNECTKDPFDTLIQGLSEEMVELKTDMDPGTGWVIGNEEICDYCDTNFVCNRISTGEYVNSWYDKTKNACWTGRQ